MNAHHFRFRLRLTIGAIAILLPTVLAAIGCVLGNPCGLPACPQPSISSYYYSSLRDVLVGSFFVFGFVLMVHGSECEKRIPYFFDWMLNFIAGICAIGLALIPADYTQIVDNPDGVWYSLHERIDGINIKLLHDIFGAVFFLAIGISIFFFYKRLRWISYALLATICSMILYRSDDLGLGIPWATDYRELTHSLLQWIGGSTGLGAFFSNNRPFFWLEVIAIFLVGIAWMLDAFHEHQKFRQSQFKPNME